jgi:CRISPR-associated endonuclease/helicase Cas3
LDIDADLLITDLCPIDVLLQRIGRLHRHTRSDRAPAFSEPKTYVISPHVNDLQCLLRSVQIGIGDPAGDRSVYPDVVTLQNTLNCINEFPQWQLPRMNRQLIETALHSVSRDACLKQRDEDWQAAEQALLGIGIGNALQATQHPLRTDLTFLQEQVKFPDGIRLPTRLGADNLRIKLEQPVRGPFGNPVQVFNVPGWMLVNSGVELDEVEVSLLGEELGRLQLGIGDVEFQYSRYGLERL